MESKDRLIVFDVEGILIPKARFMLFEVIGRIGLWSFIKAAFFGLLYELGLISTKDLLKNVYRLLEDLSFERFMSLFQGVPLMPGIEDVFEELKKSGFKIALISSGIPGVALEKMVDQLGVDYVSGLEVGVYEGRLTGEIWGDVIEPDGKAVALKKIISDKRLSSSYRIVVADDRNNLPMFKLCHLKIGYNPDFILSFKSDYVVKGDLSKIIPIILGKYTESGVRSLYKHSLLRKAIHISGFSVTIVCLYLVNRYTIAFLISLVTILYTLSETGRIFGINLPIISDITLKASGEAESIEFTASPIFYALGIIFSLILFPEQIGYASIAVLTLGDGFASVIGSKFGRKNIPFNKNKTFEGSLCGFFLAFLGSLLFLDPLKALVSSAVGMLVEVLPLPINDNLTIPFSSGLTLTALIWT